MSVYLGSSKIIVSVGENTYQLISPSDIIDPYFQGAVLTSTVENRIKDSNGMYITVKAGE